MRLFFVDTKDVYELQYGKEICKYFPLYGEFWSKYIGQRKDNSLRHYEIDNSKTHVNDFNDKYEKMTIAHYGIFVDLCGVRIDFAVLSKNSYKAVDDVLAYWNAVRNIYSKMGDSIYKYSAFLDCIKHLLNIRKVVDPVINKLKKDLESIMNMRNFMIHFTAIPFAYDKLKKIKKIPKKVYNDNGEFLPYSEILAQDIDSWVDVEKQILSDLEEIEIKFNNCHKTVLELFGKYKKFNVIDPGPASNTSILASGTSIKGDSDYFSSNSGASGCPSPA